MKTKNCTVKTNVLQCSHVICALNLELGVQSAFLLFPPTSNLEADDFNLPRHTPVTRAVAVRAPADAP